MYYLLIYPSKWRQNNDESWMVPWIHMILPQKKNKKRGTFPNGSLGLFRSIKHMKGERERVFSSVSGWWWKNCVKASKMAISFFIYLQTKMVNLGNICNKLQHWGTNTLDRRFSVFVNNLSKSKPLIIILCFFQVMTEAYQAFHDTKFWVRRKLENSVWK